MHNFWIMTITLAMIIFVTRALPFFFAEKMTENFNKLGKLLPSYIMLLLVIYQIGMDNLTTYPYALPAISALAIMTVLHLLHRNSVISMMIATLFYMYFLNR